MSKNAVEDFLDNVDESSDFASESDPMELGTEETPVTEEPAEEVIEEKPVPFHKDPKVQRFIDRQVAKALESRGSAEREFVRESKTDEDDYYERLIGNDTPEKIAMIREAKARDERLLAQAEERAWNRLTEAQQKELQADAEAEEELDNSLEEIEESFGVDITSNSPVARKTRVDFLKFVEKIAPKDRNGNLIDYPDMVSAFETFQERKQAPTSTRAKDLASRSIGRSAEVSNKPQERVTFDNMDSVFERMFGK